MFYSFTLAPTSPCGCAIVHTRELSNTVGLRLRASVPASLGFPHGHHTQRLARPPLCPSLSDRVCLARVSTVRRQQMRTPPTLSPWTRVCPDRTAAPARGTQSAMSVPLPLSTVLVPDESLIVVCAATESHYRVCASVCVCGRSARSTERVWWCARATATGSSTWSVSAWRPYPKAGSPVWNVEMVSDSGGLEVSIVNHLLFRPATNPSPSLPPPLCSTPTPSPGNHACFSCKTAEREVARCSVSGCGCYYHEDCVLKLPGATSSPGGGFCCPQHICSTCCLERDLQRASKGTTMRYRIAN